MAGKGRTPKLAEKNRRQRIIEMLRAGHYRKTAAEAAGIGEARLSIWLSKGEKEPNSIYGSFRKEVIEAETQAHDEFLRIIRRHAQEDPKQAQWWLARKYPEMWADKTRIQHEGVKDGNPITIQKVDVNAITNTATPIKDEEE